MARDPIEEFLAQVGDIIRFVKTNKVPDTELPKEVEEKLLELESIGLTLAFVSQQGLSELGMSIEDVNRAVADPAKASAQDKKLLDRIGQMKQDVQAIQQQYAIEATLARQREKNIKRAGSKRVSSRKKKFRRIGGKDNWTPM